MIGCLTSMQINPPFHQFTTQRSDLFFNNLQKPIFRRWRRRENDIVTVIASSTNVATSPPFWDSWRHDKASSDLSLSDIIWPYAGAYAAMSALGRIDQILGPKGISMSVAPLGAVCAILFTTLSSLAAQKYNNVKDLN